MHEVVRRPEARNDILEAAGQIAEYSLNASDRFLAATENTIKLLAMMPGTGTLRDYDNPALAGLRMRPISKFPRYLIFYLTTETTVEIVRVLHGAQNLHAIFAPPEE
jgi:toxin ParE1/3/4